eukprot:14336294-Ditylum_brightwellii.AAC.1
MEGHTREAVELGATPGIWSSGALQNSGGTQITQHPAVPIGEAGPVGGAKIHRVGQQYCGGGAGQGGLPTQSNMG